jgi:hypothetical protein
MSLVTLAACDGPRPAPRARTKQQLYGDPALVPTRAGERAREELARAGAVASGLAALGAEDVAVEVRLPLADDPGAVVVAGRAPPGRAEPEIRALIAALCGPWSAGVTRLAWRAEGQGGRGGELPLSLALLGLGASAGITLDRLRRRG